MDEYTTRLAELEKGHKTLNFQIKEIKDDTSSIVALMHTFDEGVKILVNIAKIAKWVTTILAPIGFIYGVWIAMKK